MAPTPAASVGVAIPEKIDPRTNKINRVGRSISFRDLHLIFHVTASEAGGAR